MQTDHLPDLGDVLVRLRTYSRGPAYRARFGVAGAGVSLSVRQVLRAVELVGRDGEVCVGDVASSLAIESSSASRQVDLAVRHGLLVKHASAIDARRLALVLTEHGHEVLRAWDQARREHLGEALADWSADEIAELVRLTARLADDIDALEA